MNFATHVSQHILLQRGLETQTVRMGFPGKRCLSLFVARLAACAT